MTDLQGLRAAVVGAGVAGLCVALELQGRGATVDVWDEHEAGGSASAIAAGMLAPAFEAAEDLNRGRYATFRAARDLWPEIARGEVALDRKGAIWTDGGVESLRAMAATLTREGVPHEILSGRALQALAPGIRADTALFTPEDWRLDPPAALNALGRRFERTGGRRLGGRVSRVEARALALQDRTHPYDAVVVTAGWGARALAQAAPELDVLTPIKGELIRLEIGAPRPGPTVRSPAGYLVPAETGMVVGGTMEAGASDRRISPAAGGRFAAFAARLYPELSGGPYSAHAAVRAATPDGLPLIGRSGSGVWLAAGFRRNGWLLAPLAARITADRMAGRDPGPWAEAMRPGRFSPA